MYVRSSTFLVSWYLVVITIFLPTGCKRHQPEKKDPFTGPKGSPSPNVEKGSGHPSDRDKVIWKGSIEELRALKYTGKFQTEFKDRWLETSGTVSFIAAIGPEARGRGLILTSGKENLSCVVPRQEAPPGRFSKGQKVRVQGILDPSLGSTLLGFEKCRVIEVGPSQAAEFAADEFVRMYLKDQKKAHEKYRNLTLI
ncbi:MAG TPA: hypothetical protein VLM40_19060, partial [Gemmata sp.]|nr:hypothetical protein [Gemmata sp.]